MKTESQKHCGCQDWYVGSVLSLRPGPPPPSVRREGLDLRLGVSSATVLVDPIALGTEVMPWGADNVAC